MGGSRHERWGIEKVSEEGRMKGGAQCEKPEEKQAPLIEKETPKLTSKMRCKQFQEKQGPTPTLRACTQLASSTFVPPVDSGAKLVGQSWLLSHC
jgi:hypothetical protein